MDFGSSYLPVEIATNIVQRLPNKDKKNVRRVSKGFSDVVTRFLFETAYISTKLADRTNFTAISEHPVIGRMVKEVVYESTNLALTEDGLTDFDPNRTSYTRFVHHHFRYFSGSRITNYSKASIQRGFDSFKKAFDEQTELARYHQSDMRKNGDDLSCPPDFSSLLMDPKSHPDVLKYLPDDLVRLVRGLPRMPGVKRFKITDYRYSKYDESHPINYFHGSRMNSSSRLSVSVRNKGFRGVDRVILNPRSWPSENERGDDVGCDRTWYRAFFVLTQAASMTNMKGLESFHVDTKHVTSGLSHVIFFMSHRELYHAMNAFSHLTIIQLKIQTGISDGLSWKETMTQGDLARILGAAKHLEVLDLDMDTMNYGQVHFENIIGNHTWPKLRKVKLARMRFASDRNEFLEFFKRHQYSLCSLWLEQVMIVAGEAVHMLVPNNILRLGWTVVPRKPEPSSRWVEIMGAMASDRVALTEMTYFENNFRHKPSGWVFHSCNPTTVVDFLRSGGNNRPTVPCQHQERDFSFEKERHSFAR